MPEPPQLALFKAKELRFYSELFILSQRMRSSDISYMRVCVYVSNPLEKLNEQPGVTLHHVGLQVRQRDQLIEQLNEENMVLFAEPPAVQLEKPEGER